MGRTRKLAYDVGVNVVANLIAAAILYLLGAYAGLFRTTPAALAAAITLLTVLLLSAVLTAIMARNHSQRVTAAAGALLQIVIIVGLAVVDVQNPALDIAGPTPYAISGFLLLVMLAAFLSGEKGERRSR